MGSYSKKYFPNLDATRFIAFLAVFLEHMLVTDNPAIKSSSFFAFYNRHFHLASLGVGFFIVLSGFLITWIILEEYKFTSSFNMSFFWARRCLRIWPLYFLLIFIGYLLIILFLIGLPWKTGHSVHELPPFGWLATFTLNFYIINHGQAFLFFIVFLWSIAVEEQLYVLWAIILKWLKKLFIPLCLLLIIVSVAFRAMYITDSANLYFNTLNWIPDFALGGLIAYAGINGGKWFDRMKALSKPIILSVYVLFILNLVLYDHLYPSAIMTIFQRLIDALFFAFFIFEQAFCDNRLFNAGKSKQLSYMGKISYGLYVYHGLVILLFTKVMEHLGWLNNSVSVFIINPVLIFVVTLVISAVSFTYFEKPIMALRYKIKQA